MKLYYTLRVIARGDKAHLHQARAKAASVRSTGIPDKLVSLFVRLLVK